jgi:hypothetical protein
MSDSEDYREDYLLLKKLKRKDKDSVKIFNQFKNYKFLIRHLDDVYYDVSKKGLEFKCVDDIAGISFVEPEVRKLEELTKPDVESSVHFQSEQRFYIFSQVVSADKLLDVVYSKKEIFPSYIDVMHHYVKNLEFKNSFFDKFKSVLGSKRDVSLTETIKDISVYFNEKKNNTRFEKVPLSLNKHFYLLCSSDLKNIRKHNKKYL